MTEPTQTEIDNYLDKVTHYDYDTYREIEWLVTMALLQPREIHKRVIQEIKTHNDGSTRTS